MKKYLLTAMLISMTSLASFGQTMNAFLTAADNAFATKDYYSALVYYTNALEFDDQRIDLVYKSAEAARLFQAYSLSEQYYAQVASNDADGAYPLSQFYLGLMQQRLGKYADATTNFDLYLSEHEGDNQYFTDRAKKERKACEWAADVLANPDESITLNRLGSEINTQYSEFGSHINDSDLYFTSMRFNSEVEKAYPAKLYSRLLKSEDDSTAVELEGDINSPTIHTAHTSFNRNNDRVYYTLCDYINPTDIRCDLYYRSVDEDGNFGEAVMLPESINKPGFTTTQPNIAWNNDLSKEVLYFVSNRDGGHGKLDIWYAEVTDSGFGEPQNLDSLNTNENEISPFFHTNTGTLYFSSDGYQSLGGYDIYKSEYRNGEFGGSPDHMPAPTNSSFHDTYYTLSDDMETAYFSSNRDEGAYLDTEKEACCFDIYKADIEPITVYLEVLTFDKLTKLDLMKCTVTLTNLDDESKTDIKYEELTNFFNFELDRGRSYLVKAERMGYKPDSVFFNTKKIYRSDTIRKKLFLESDFIELEVLTFDKRTLEALYGTTVSLIDETDNTVADVVKINEEGNQFLFSVLRGKKYKIVGSKINYSTGLATLDTTEEIYDRRIRRKLYLERDLDLFLPLSLYFDNDRPNRRTFRAYTNKTYSDTYTPYYSRKKTFKSRYGRPLAGEERVVAEQELEEFFELSVKGGYDKLQSFMSAVLKALESGQTLDISIRGYTSPLAQSKYNLALGQRRIGSVQNELEKYMDGALKPYLESGQLSLTDVSFGETTSPTGVSDSGNDRRNSIYSIAASKERRVEIVKVESSIK